MAQTAPDSIPTPISGSVPESPSVAGRIDRRRHTRRNVVVSCEVYHRGTHVCAPGRTSNLSASGALLCVDRSVPIAAGDEIDVVADWGTGETTPAQGRRVRSARVVRVTSFDAESQAVAVAIDAPGAAAVGLRAA